MMLKVASQANDRHFGKWPLHLFDSYNVVMIVGDSRHPYGRDSYADCRRPISGGHDHRHCSGNQEPVEVNIFRLMQTRGKQSYLAVM